MAKEQLVESSCRGSLPSQVQEWSCPQTRSEQWTSAETTSQPTSTWCTSQSLFLLFASPQTEGCGRAQAWLDRELRRDPNYDAHAPEADLSSHGVAQFEQALRNGVALAKLARVFDGKEAVPRIYTVRPAAAKISPYASCSTPSWLTRTRTISITFSTFADGDACQK